MSAIIAGPFVVPIKDVEISFDDNANEGTKTFRTRCPGHLVPR